MDYSFLTGTNATFVAEMYQRWKQLPNTVDPDWAEWFANLDELSTDAYDEKSPSWGKPRSKVIGANDPDASIKAVAKAIAGKDCSAARRRGSTAVRGRR